MMRESMFNEEMVQVIEIGDDHYTKLKNLIKDNFGDKKYHKSLEELRDVFTTFNVITDDGAQWMITADIDADTGIVQLFLFRETSTTKNQQKFYISADDSFTLLDWLPVSKEIEDARNSMSSFLDSLEANMKPLMDSIAKMQESVKKVQKEDLCTEEILLKTKKLEELFALLDGFL